MNLDKTSTVKRVGLVTWIWRTVKSKNVKLLWTSMTDFGPVHPIEVPNPPFNLMTANYSSWKKIKSSEKMEWNFCEVTFEANMFFSSMGTAVKLSKQEKVGIRSRYCLQEMKKTKPWMGNNHIGLRRFDLLPIDKPINFLCVLKTGKQFLESFHLGLERFSLLRRSTYDLFEGFWLECWDGQNLLISSCGEWTLKRSV